MQEIKLFNTKVHNLTLQETVELVDSAIFNQEQIHYADLNAGKIVDIQEDLGLRESVNTADIINADGQAVVWAYRLLGEPIKERVAGVDLMQKLVEMAAEKSYKIYLLGAEEEVVTVLNEIYTKKYGKNLVAGYRNGYFNSEEEAEVVADIVSSGAQMLFVGIASPMKENFLAQHQEALSHINFVMGVGGSFDVFSGKVKRAPVWMQKLGMEWSYRFAQEPKRMWKRYLIGNSKFIYLVLKESWHKKFSA